MGKFRRWAGNVASIPVRCLGTACLGGADVIDTIVGAGIDAGTVIINTKNKIIDLFSDNLKRYQKILNVPVVAGVGIAGLGELVSKPVINAGANTLKTAVNLVTNTYKSTLGSLLSTKPLSDTKFNTIKRKGQKYKIDTEKRILNPNNLRTEYRGFLPPDKRRQQLEKKRAKIEALLNKL